MLHFNLIKYDIVDKATVYSAQFRYVKFIKDFGPIKKDEEHYCVRFDYMDMKCVIFSENNTKIHEFDFEFTA